MSDIQSELPPVRKAVEQSGHGRRRLLRAGLAGPVVLTVGSRSALANGGCLSTSASASINLYQSRPDRELDPCPLGRSPGYWGNAAQTHSNTLARDTQFSDPYSLGFQGKSIEAVIKLDGNDDSQQLGAHLGAAWCNLRMGWVPESLLSLQTLQAMWDGRSQGFHPVAGADLPVWDRSQVVDYLKTTMA
ncbi:MAG: hypothetical protein KJ614_01115 [Gammaproteobacteria bacterium]|uniref:hypothetical protein n=1 Tax=Rhodoferax sp. TaxID=50421 RepID=UPI0017CC488E|nr:hypothetical protein [Rhodoferax sp.]MBU3897524.1 hypothetical protein [Gammaproteobacteria bacterium]MBA3058031.1 hypothetical protein [Rhodoferax sp.]MBU3999361.1 hypothetical protein [Gammaproteobacteria bacterium]MBU4018870.1 hypothetical protein [Gammaproteobacteria bacterium]MBU4079825.1 hypothetical protein [Gammaproteobacteria bacterium]